MNIFWHTLPEKLVYAASMICSGLINGGKDPGSLSFRNILCIKQDEIGDLCYSLHVIDMLKAQFPSAKLTLLCKPFAITLTNNNRNIDHITSNWKDLSHNYDLVVDLRGSWRSVFFALRTRPLYRLDRGTVRYRNRKAGKHPHEVITNLEIVSPIISPANRSTSPRIYFGRDELKKADDFLVDNNIGAFAILHPGARRELRKWDKFDQLARYLKNEKKLDVIFTGDHHDLAGIKSWQQKAGVQTQSVAGLFNLAEFAALCSKAKLYIGNESGPLHIASVCGTPTLGLYGPGEPHVFYPWGPKTAYLHEVLPCNPCDQVHCVHPENPCIRRITMTDVINKLQTIA